MQTTTSRTAPSPVERFRLDGHLTAESITATLAGVARRLELAGRPSVLVIDLLGMESYEPACRVAFTGWYKRNSAAIRAVAGVTNRASWRVIISAIGLATKGQFKSFEVVDEAMRWAHALPPE